MLTVVGGTYFEVCHDPKWHELYGSGLRGAIALSGHVSDISFKTCVGNDAINLANAICNSFNIKPDFVLIPETIVFEYYHPLTKPLFYPSDFLNFKTRMPDVSAESILVYGQIEAEVKVSGSYVVYDPQNGISYKFTGSTATHLALVLNHREALLLSGLTDQDNLEEVGKALLKNEEAEVVVIKNGPHGALVVDCSGTHIIPVFKTSSVWPIGSGDIFSAAFAWKWALEKLPAAEAALLASRFTAQYCQSRILPLPVAPNIFQQLRRNTHAQKLYLAGPFFTVAERWLINELRCKLIEFGNDVFSPLHDVGRGGPDQVVGKDLAAIENADVVLAVLNGEDPGTIFEIGYAKALKKRVVVLAENTLENDLTMLIGSGCEITNDFTTAVYMASW
ncbi:PfkB family carbohydrate kinase [Larkinella bovis]|uniref:PfkB family carbohydrate kinase n=1 Tax=Larkinella bovis TaxID=683041 RepID=A0ABW0II82_9BACT